MGPSFATPLTSRDDVHFRARKFLGGICPQNITYLDNFMFSRSLIKDSLLNCAKEKSCFIEDTLLKDSSAITGSTTFNSLRYSPEDNNCQQLASQLPQDCLQEISTFQPPTLSSSPEDNNCQQLEVSNIRFVFKKTTLSYLFKHRHWRV